MVDFAQLARQIKRWGQELGFDQIGIADIDLSRAAEEFKAWLARGFHGEMDYMARHGAKRWRPELLVPRTVRVISARLEYLPEPQERMWEALCDPERAYISRYALGRDYHRVVKRRLERLAQTIRETIGPFGYRVFCDSAPVLEVPFAQKAGLGFVGKNSLLIAFKRGSWSFLGEIYVDLPLPTDPPIENRYCGSCTACIDLCPTKAIVSPGVVDARRCISYLTIELKGPIPEPFRPLIGNRIYGCDDCQLVCPWNRKAALTNLSDFKPRHGLERAKLTQLFRWSEETFLKRTEGSAIRRIGYERWLRNIAVALGNAPSKPEVVEALKEKAHHPSPLVREHVLWALRRHGLAKGRP